MLRPVGPGTVLVSSAFVDEPFMLVCLFEAEDCARWCDSGRDDCVEFCRAREEGGLCGALGAGLLRWSSFESVDVPTTGEETRDGGPAADALVLFLSHVNSRRYSDLSRLIQTFF